MCTLPIEIVVDGAFPKLGSVEKCVEMSLESEIVFSIQIDRKLDFFLRQQCGKHVYCNFQQPLRSFS